MNIIVFTDGSSIRKRGKIEAAGYGIYFPNKEFDDISEPFMIKPYTNQRSELYAIYMAIKIITESKINFDFIRIYTDSEYSIKSLTKWIFGWVKNGWKKSNNKPVMNTDILKELYKYIAKYKNKIIFVHVRSHTGKKDSLSIGNSKADELAVKGSLKFKKIADRKSSKYAYIKIGKTKKRVEIKF